MAARRGPGAGGPRRRGRCPGVARQRGPPGPGRPGGPSSARWQEEFPLALRPAAEGGPLKPQCVIEALRDLSPDDTIVASGVGQHQMWASQYWRSTTPTPGSTPAGAGTMGFAVPAAIGAKVGRPDRRCGPIDGDGCFQMTAQELVTASAERIPVKIAILNNAYLGMVRQWQEMFYEERYSEVYLSPDLPDYVGWAEAMGCVGIRVESPEEVAPAIDKANAIDDRPVVIDFRTDAFEKVFPMVPAGASNDDIVVDPCRRRGGRPMSVYGTDTAPPHPLRPGREQGRRAGPGGRTVLPPRLQHLRLAVAPTDDERFSRITIVVDVESAPLDQIIKQLDKLINVVVDHRAGTRPTPSSASCCWPPSRPAPTTRGQVIQLVGVFEGKIVDVGPTTG